MAGWEWLNTAAGAASLLGLWVTIAAFVTGWVWTRSTTKLVREVHGETQRTLDAMDARWAQAFERMDQRADERHREVIQAIQAMRG
jgi:hypothetical protein